MVLKRPEPRQKRPGNSKLVFQGKLFKVWQWEQQLFDGSYATFEQLSRPDTVLILPLQEESLLLAREKQPGMRAMLRALGGRVEEGEDPLAAAKRELYEESGLKARNYKLWNAWQPVNKIDWSVYLFIATDLEKNGDQKLDPGEEIDLHSIQVSEIFRDEFNISIDDNELLYQIGLARSNANEKQRVLDLLCD